MKPREFWIADIEKPLHEDSFIAYNYDPFLGPYKKIHVREIMPIDWNAIKNRYRGPMMHTESWGKIKELVEKYLKGEPDETN